MVTVSISETYDLHTQVGKMTLIGIHSPPKDLIQRTYPGLAMNCKYFRIKSVDVVLSTAQTLPLGVSDIGLDSGQIHPQDMMNPILYKAVSNDSWSTLEARLMGLYNQTLTNDAPPLNGSMAFAESDNVTGIADEHMVYYSLLSNRDGFRAAMPQQGLQMKGLVPLVFDKWYVHGENSTSQSGSYPDFDGAPVVRETSSADPTLKIVYQNSAGMRGRAHPMPKINTTYLTGITGSVGDSNISNGMGTGTPTNSQIQMPDVPPVMLGAIVLPPVSATTGILYYRMVCRCFIEFSDVRPIQEITSFAQMNSIYGPLVYHTDYAEQSKQMDETTDMVDVKNANIQKIMEGQ